MASGTATFELDGPGATEAFAAGFAEGLRRGDVIALSGGLGSGKTVFARGLIRAVGAASGEPVGEVPSPTYTLVQPYEFARLTLWHFDLYRLSSAEEALELAIEDAFAEGASVIEWAERAEGLLPAAAVRIHLEAGDRPELRVARLADGRERA